MKLTGENRNTRRKTCSSATLSTTNPTWTDPGSNPGLRGERPAANRQSHGTTLVSISFMNHIGKSSIPNLLACGKSNQFIDKLYFVVRDSKFYRKLGTAKQSQLMHNIAVYFI
jgi:hypothetical protein